MTEAAKRLPIDPAALAVPIRAFVIEGIAYAWDEATDGAWTGEWAFPPKGWDDGTREAWIGTQGHLIAVKRAHEAGLAAADAVVTSAAYLLAEARAEVAATIRQTEIDKRVIEGAKAWQSARETYGAHNVRSIPTVEGDVVIILASTAKELDAANAAAKSAYDLRIAHDPKAIAEANSEYAGVHRDWIVGKCIWPGNPADPKDKTRIREIAEAHPDLWVELHMARNDMARARIDEEGKGSAP